MHYEYVNSWLPQQQTNDDVLQHGQRQVVSHGVDHEAAIAEPRVISNQRLVQHVLFKTQSVTGTYTQNCKHIRLKIEAARSKNMSVSTN